MFGVFGFCQQMDYMNKGKDKDNWVSGSTRSYLKVGSEPFSKQMCLTQSVRPCCVPGKGICFHQKSSRFHKNDILLLFVL